MYHANAVITISMPVGLSGRRYQANSPIAANPYPITGVSTIHSVWWSLNSAVAIRGTSAAPVSAAASAIPHRRARLSLMQPASAAPRRSARTWR